MMPDAGNSKKEYVHPHRGGGGGGVGVVDIMIRIPQGKQSHSETYSRITSITFVHWHSRSRGPDM